MALMYLLELYSNTVNVMIEHNCINTRKKSSFFRLTYIFPVYCLKQTRGAVFTSFGK